MSTFTTTDGVELDYRVDGPADAPGTLVMLHGWSQSRAMFDRALPLLSRSCASSRTTSGATAIRPSRTTGRGSRGWPPTCTSCSATSAWTARTWLGHSLGASVLWSFIDSYGTSRLESLIIVDQPSACVVLPWMDPDEGASAGAILDFAGAEQFVKAVATDDRDTRYAFLVSMLTKDIPADDLAYMNLENLKLPARWGGRLLLDHIMQDWRDVLPLIDVPTVVLAARSATSTRPRSGGPPTTSPARGCGCSPRTRAARTSPSSRTRARSATWSPRSWPGDRPT